MTSSRKFNETCTLCHKIYSLASNLYRYGHTITRTEFHSLPRWKESSLSCHMCSIALHKASEENLNYLQSLGEKGEIETSTISVDIGPTHHTGTVIVLLKSPATPILAELYICIKQDGTSSEYVAPTSAETWSEPSSQQLKTWLADCIRSHVDCRSSARQGSVSSARLPTRLLEIGAFESEMQQTQSLSNVSIDRLPYLRLRDSIGLPPDTRYVTLSHCWGRHPTVAWGRHPAITLTNETLERFYSHVNLADVTSPEGTTFKHAVQVARNLGFQYLWIDALCINQDDHSEKLREISIMDEIYANSMLNISATASYSGSDGLFFSRNTIPIAACKWRAYFGEKGNVTLGELVAYANRWSEEVTQAPVNTRAWVFQERTLATRIVHFSRDQIFWECASLKAAEVYPHGMPYQNQYHSFGTQPHEREPLRSWQAANTTSNMEPWEVCQEIWASLIPTYSRNKLTFDADKFPAISGVARRLCVLSKLDPTDYLAGLWRPGFVEQLLWRADLAPNKPRPTSLLLFVLTPRSLGLMRDAIWLQRLRTGNPLGKKTSP